MPVEPASTLSMYANAMGIPLTYLYGDVHTGIEINNDAYDAFLYAMGMRLSAAESFIYGKAFVKEPPQDRGQFLLDFDKVGE